MRKSVKDKAPAVSHTAAIVKKRREELRMSRQELADKLDVCLQTVYRYESEGVDVALLQKYQKLAEVLQIPITELLGIDPENNSGRKQDEIDRSKQNG